MLKSWWHNCGDTWSFMPFVIIESIFSPLLNCNLLSNGLNLSKSNAQMILKTVCALVALLLELFNSYGDGEFDWSNGYAPSLHIILDKIWLEQCVWTIFTQSFLIACLSKKTLQWKLISEIQSGFWYKCMFRIFYIMFLLQMHSLGAYWYGEPTVS